MKSKNVDYNRLASELLILIGGPENVVNLSHCVTRLRFLLKDYSLPKTGKIEAIPGVLKAVHNGGQYQVIIGMEVQKAYEAMKAAMEKGVQDVSGYAKESVSESTFGTGTVVNGVPEGVPGGEPSGKGTTSGMKKGNVQSFFKKALGSISRTLVGCMTPLIPVMVSVGIIRTLAILCGPEILGWLGEDSGTYQIFNMVGQSGYYFLPVLAAWAASNYFATNTVLSIFFGAFLVYPDLTRFLETGNAKLYGIPVIKASYPSQVVPAILIIAAMSLVEKLLKKRIPQSAQFILLPILETLIMLPLMLCLVGPLGAVLGNGIAALTVALHNLTGVFSVALVGGFFIFICATGMHSGIVAISLALIKNQGYDDTAMVGAVPAAYACFAVYLAYTVFSKDKNEKELGFGALVTHAVGGIAEPGMFSLLLLRKDLLSIQVVSAFAGAFYIGLMGVGMYAPGISNIMAVMQLSGGDPSNLKNGMVGCGISFVCALILTSAMLLHKDKKASVGKNESGVSA